MAQHWGKYRAEVINNKDPNKRGRVLIKCPSLMGDNELGWAESCFPPGVFTLPRPGDLVWVEFEGGQIGNPIWVGMMPTRSYVKSYLFKEYGDRDYYDPQIHIYRSDNHKGLQMLDMAAKGENKVLPIG